MCKSSQCRMYQFGVSKVWLEFNLVIHELTLKDQLFFERFDPMNKLYFSEDIDTYSESLWLVKKTLQSRMDKLKERLLRLEYKPITIFTFWFWKQIPYLKNHLHLSLWQMIEIQVSQTEVTFNRKCEKIDFISKIIEHLSQFEGVV